MDGAQREQEQRGEGRGFNSECSGVLSGLGIGPDSSRVKRGKGNVVDGEE